MWYVWFARIAHTNANDGRCEYTLGSTPWIGTEAFSLIQCNRFGSYVVRENSIWNERERAALCLQAETQHYLGSISFNVV